MAEQEEPLVNLMVEQTLRAESLKAQYVAFIDMLGFSDLTKTHPGSMTIEVAPDHSWLTTGTSKSAERLGRFHAILDRLAANEVDSSHPEQMMIFSDCAFAIYRNALQAAVSLAPVMWQFLSTAVPVRMGIAKGTCHYQRFGMDSNPHFTVTRSMFYGSGVVFATEAEKSGKGCRIFLHNSLDAQDLASINSRYLTLQRVPATEISEHELNYLQEADSVIERMHPVELPTDRASWRGLVALQEELDEPADPKIQVHYDESFAALNRMQKQHGRPVVAPPERVR